MIIESPALMAIPVSTQATVDETLKLLETRVPFTVISTVKLPELSPKVPASSETPKIKFPDFWVVVKVPVVVTELPCAVTLLKNSLVF